MILKGFIFVLFCIIITAILKFGYTENYDIETSNLPISFTE